MQRKNKEQIDLIQEQYKKWIGEIPACLEYHFQDGIFAKLGFVETIQGKYPAKETDFESGRFNAALGNNSLHKYAGDIVIQCCNYQKLRNGRLFGGGNLGDPTNLLLEELKVWVRDKLSFDSCRNLDPVIQKRIEYLNAIAGSGLFSPGSNNEGHLEIVLMEVLNILRDQIQPKIQDELDNESAGQELGELTIAAEKLTLNMVNYLYFAIRDEKTSNDYTLDNIRESKLSDQHMERSLQTASGKLLKTVVTDKPMQELFPGNHNRHLPLKKNDVANQLKLALDVSNAFIKSPGSGMKPVANRSMLNHLLQEDSSGIYSEFLNEEILSAFVEIHGLALELARFTLICKRFHKMAGLGGDILIYGIANKPVKDFIRTFFPLANSLFSSLGVIRLLTEKIFKQNITHRIAWVNNSRSASNFYTIMVTENKKCLEYAEKILSKAERGIDEIRKQQIMEEIGIGIDSAIKFAKNMSMLFPGVIMSSRVKVETGLTGSQALFINDYKPEATPSRLNNQTPQHSILPSHASRSSSQTEKIISSYAPDLDVEVEPLSDDEYIANPSRKLFINTSEKDVKDNNVKTVLSLKHMSDKSNGMPSFGPSSHHPNFFRINPKPLVSNNKSDAVSNIHERNEPVNLPRDAFHISYVRNFFNGFSPEDKQRLLDLYDQYMSAQKEMGQLDRPSGDEIPLEGRARLNQQENFLIIFASDNYFSNSVSSYCRAARNIILNFERKEMEYKKPFISDWLWEQRHLEIFCLKHLCVEAVMRSDDMQLALFICDLKSHADERLFYSQYDALKQNLANLDMKRVRGHVVPHFNTNVDRNLMKEKEKLRKKADENDGIEKRLRSEFAEEMKEMREQNKKRDEQDKKRDEQDKKRDEQINQLLEQMNPRPDTSRSFSF